jgi:hypothetical protein
MFKNRFLLVLGLLSLLLVAMSVLEEAERIQQSGAADTARWEAMGEYYAKQAEAEPKAAPPSIMDSATRSYIARGMAILAERNEIDSATQSYIAQGEAILAERNRVDSATQSYIARGMAILAERNKIDSATQSYIAQGRALEATDKPGASGACSSAAQENIFARIPDNLNSATRSYIARGLALQAKDDFGALCR